MLRSAAIERGTLLCTAVLGLALLPDLASGLTLTGGMDTYVREALPDNSFDGLNEAEWDGLDGGGENHALIYIPIFTSEGGAIANPTALFDPRLRARLVLDVTNAGSGGSFHRLDQAFDGNTTWNTLGGSGVVPGANAASAVDGSSGSASAGTLSVDVTSSLQAWALDPSTNHGWGVVPLGNNGLGFATHETGNGPSLVIDYQLVGSGSDWRYYDGIAPGDPTYPTDGLGRDWRDVAFDDAAWGQGAGQLGFGDGDEATTVAAGNITYLFRTSFLVDEVTNSLEIDLLFDDSAIVYLNGVEVIRENLPGSGVDASTTASSVGTENDLQTFIIDPGLLVLGTNVLAVEVHNVSTTSSDISFDLDLRVGMDPTILTTPEPETAVLMGLGLALLARDPRRRRPAAPL